MLDDIRRRGKDASAKEQALAEALHVVYEAMARGVEFLPVDLYKSHSYKFIMEDGKIRLPFSAVKGLGTAAAEGLMAAREGGEYISCDDLQQRSGITKAVVEPLRQLGAARRPAGYQPDVLLLIGRCPAPEVPGAKGSFRNPLTELLQCDSIVAH